MILRGVDLTKINPDGARAIEAAMHASGGVLLFQDQPTVLTPQEHVRLGMVFGPCDEHSFAAGLPEAPHVLEIVREPEAEVVFGENWHSDNSFLPHTASYSILRGHEVHMPRRGSNDTLFCQMEWAYDELPEELREPALKLRAYHSANKAYMEGSETNSLAAMKATKTMKP